MEATLALGLPSVNIRKPSPSSSAMATVEAGTSPEFLSSTVIIASSPKYSSVGLTFFEIISRLAFLANSSSNNLDLMGVPDLEIIKANEIGVSP